MFNRDLLKWLKSWKQEDKRKPLILRGARQVGKTSLVHLFGKEYEQYLYLNFELPKDVAAFKELDELSDILQSLFLRKKLQFDNPNTLIFIDEIQEYPPAIALLRYFYEEYPDLHVIAAGSLLENVFDLDISFPVGRVDYLPVRPLSFKEFLQVTGDDLLRLEISKIPLSKAAEQPLLEKFHTYTLIGGMPEIVASYAAKKDITQLQPIYDSILVPYLDDIAKYAKNESQANVLRHIIKIGLQQAGQRISFENFGKSSYKSREVGDAFRLLEKSYFARLVYPVTETQLPVIPSLAKSPRLQMLDTGLVNYFSGIQASLLKFNDLNDAYRGRITEHIVYQELLTLTTSVFDILHFWVREKKTSSAEVDFVLPHKGALIPIEIKSGAKGKLRSLHQFIDKAPLKFGVRLYAGPITVEQTKTIAGTPFLLLNLPYYLISEIGTYIDWAQQNNTIN